MFEDIKEVIVSLYQYRLPENAFHNSYVILELVPITVIVWTELSCGKVLAVIEARKHLCKR
jgi:hypothetical protein